VKTRPAPFLVFLSVAVCAAAVGSHAVAGPEYAAGVSAGVVVYVAAFSAVHAEEAPGAGDAVTFVRAALLAYVAGFVVSPPDGTEAWLVGGVFVAAAVLDAADGAVARRTRETTLGESLDGEVDGLSVLVGATVGVVGGWATRGLSHGRCGSLRLRRGNRGPKAARNERCRTRRQPDP